MYYNWIISSLSKLIEIPIFIVMMFYIHSKADLGSNIIQKFIFIQCFELQIIGILRNYAKCKSPKSFCTWIHYSKLEYIKNNNCYLWFYMISWHYCAQCIMEMDWNGWEVALTSILVMFNYNSFFFTCEIRWACNMNAVGYICLHLLLDSSM